MAPKTEKNTISKKKYDALVFDLDGVVTQTAKVHASAWKKLFDEYLKQRGASEGIDYAPFDKDKDYKAYVDGKPRYEGVKSFLESRGIDLSYGDPDDPPEKESICGLGNRKNRFFHKKLEQEGVRVYEPTRGLIMDAREAGMKTAIVSSSKNCGVVLETAGLTQLFDEKIDGVDLEQVGLKGKPEPDIFLEAVHRLGVEPSRAVAFEDAEAGVDSAGRAGFGLVIGINRGDHANELTEKGAHLVVNSTSRLTIENKESVTGQSIPSALSSLEDIKENIRNHKVAVFLDYDGTLTPIVNDPEKALISDRMREALMGLSGRCNVAIISGRDLGDVREKVGVDNLVYAGSHGFDIAGPSHMNIQSQKGEEFLPRLERAENRLRKELCSISGAMVERKKFSVAVHYRKVKDRVEEVEKIVDGVINDEPSLKKSSGKKVFEVQPRIDWHKGKALLWLLEQAGLNKGDEVSFYIGDDTTDEDAFKSLPDKGIGIVVMETPRKTAAHYSLKDPGEVERFIRELTKVL